MGQNWFLTIFPMLAGLIADMAMSGWAGPRPGLTEALHRRVWWLPSVVVALGALAVAATAPGLPLPIVASVGAIAAAATLWCAPRRADRMPPPKWVRELRKRTAPSADAMHFWRLSVLLAVVVSVAIISAATM